MDYLKEIYTKDIELLIQDLELVKRGYEINYIMDASDVFSYTFPYGINFDKVNNLTPDDIGDRLIAYEYIFRYYYPIILDEYKLELILNRNSIKTNNDSKFSKDFLTNSIEIFENSKKLDDQIDKSATFLLSAALMQKPMVNFFDEVYNNKLQVDTFKLNSAVQIDENIISELFENNKRSDWSSETFKVWIENINPYKYSEDINKVRNIYKSTLRDIIAIDRICRINFSIQMDTRLSRKYIFLYYSGAKKSGDIFTLKEVIEHLPKIDNIENYEILRTPKHSYLLFLIFDKDINKMLSTLNSLKRISFTKENNADLLSNLKSKSLSEEDRHLFEVISQRKRDILEYDGIANQINKHQSFQNKIKKLIEKLKKSENLTELASIYENLLEKAKEATDNIGIIQINLSYIIQGKLLNLIKILIDKEDFVIPRGKDLIKGSYQHLPILLFLNGICKIEDNVSANLYFEVVNFLVKSSRPRKIHLPKFIKFIKDTYYQIEDDNNNIENFQDILVKLFVYMIIDKNEEKVEKVAFLLLQDTYILLNTSKDSLIKWEADYLYMLAWLSRRALLLNESNKFCEEGIEKFPGDPRFIHGRCLYVYNSYFNRGSLESCNKTQLLEIIDLTEEAILSYKTWIKNNSFNDLYFKGVKGNISALTNSLLYFISLYYLDILEKGNLLNNYFIHNYSLENLRDNLLTEIKKIEEEMGNPPKDVAEYCHTEAVFELVEGIYYQSNSKLSFAEKEIKIALDFFPNSGIYNKTKMIIGEWKTRLSQ